MIHDWFPHGTLQLTLAGVIAQSSNIGTVMAARHVQAGPAAPLPHRVRARPAHRHRRQRRDPGPAAATARVDRRCPGPHRLRPVRLGQRRADGRGGQHDRQRRRPGLAEPDPGLAPPPTTAQPSAPTTTTRNRVVSANAAHQMTLMMERVVDPDVGVAPARPGARATASPARPAPRSASAPSAAATTARSRSRSPASPRPTTRASRSTSWCRTRATAAAAARSPARRSPRSCPSRCAATASRRPAPSPRSSRPRGDRRSQRPGARVVARPTSAPRPATPSPVRADLALADLARPAGGRRRLAVRLAATSATRASPASRSTRSGSRPGDLYAALPGARGPRRRRTGRRPRAAGAVAVLTDAAGAARAGDDVPVLVVDRVRAGARPPRRPRVRRARDARCG